MIYFHYYLTNAKAMKSPPKGKIYKNVIGSNDPNSGINWRGKEAPYQ